ncbi:MAG: alpha/beta hydrolase [Deltaproteobacteria bacterium]|nr:alpha/beta hydrolase [Deltaproteobacteria bacterium]
MVLKGQYLERPVLIRVGELCLEGLYHRGDHVRPVLILPPHPQLGGSMDSPVVAELAWALTRAGHPTLRMNYRGVGASQGEWEGGEHDVGDLRQAVEHLAETTGAAPEGGVALVGYSYGADLTLRALAGGLRAAAVILIAPPVTLLDPSEHLRVLPETFARTGELVTFCGDEDEVAPPARVAEVFGLLGERHREERIPGADHVFRVGLQSLGQQVAQAAGKPVRR